MIKSKAFVVGSLATDSFVAVNKKLLRYFKGDATLAVVLCEIISVYKYQLENHKVDALDAFPLPIVFLERTLSLSAYKQQHAIARLQADHLLESALIGKPASRWITLNFEAIAELLTEAEHAMLQHEAEKLEFYERINIAANADDRMLLEQALDNIKTPLRGCIVAATQHARKLGAVVEWSSEAVGLLKLVIRNMHKHDLFDYGRFEDLLSISSEIKTGDMKKTAKELQQKWKLVAERSPGERIYSYEV